MTLSTSLAMFVVAAAAIVAADPEDWPMHDRTRPAPKTIEPGTASTPTQAGRAPNDAVVVFDGKDLSHWRDQKTKGPAGWKLSHDYFEVVKGTGDVETTQAFGDCQLHIEWATPSPAVGEDQDRGNSGVFLMGIYEVQVLDSYGNATYPDGQAGALYGQFPPLVNAVRPPGEWQSYDIVFHGPRFDAQGAVLRPARMTVLLNGVLIQDNRELLGPTTHKVRTPYSAHPEKLPLSLQDHGHPVRYRNVWVREIPD